MNVIAPEFAKKFRAEQKQEISMTNHIGVGSELEVVFTTAPRGARVVEPINGRPAYATESCDAPIPGDRWKVMIVAMNSRRTVYFVEPLELVDAHDGLTDVLRPYSPFSHEYIREAEAVIAEIFANATAINAYLPEQAAGDEVRLYLKEALLLPPEYVEQKLAALPPSISSLTGEIYGHHETQHGIL